MLIDQLRLRLERPEWGEMEGIAPFQRGRKRGARNGHAGQGSAALDLTEPRSLEHAVEIPARRAEMGPVGAKRIGVHMDRASLGRRIDLVDVGERVEVADIEPGVVAPAVDAGSAPEVNA